MGNTNETAAIARCRYCGSSSGRDTEHGLWLCSSCGETTDPSTTKKTMKDLKYVLNTEIDLKKEKHREIFNEFESLHDREYLENIKSRLPVQNRKKPTPSEEIKSRLEFIQEDNKEIKDHQNKLNKSKYNLDDHILLFNSNYILKWILLISVSGWLIYSDSIPDWWDGLFPVLLWFVWVYYFFRTLLRLMTFLFSSKKYKILKTKAAWNAEKKSELQELSNEMEENVKEERQLKEELKTLNTKDIPGAEVYKEFFSNYPEAKKIFNR